MNVLLEKDNIELKTNIEKVTDARVLSAEVNFEEFGTKNADQETCYKFLAGIKWVADFACIKCEHNSYKTAVPPYSRRCVKCNYKKSVLYNTIFQNNRIPINKAFYIVYLIYTTKSKISSYQLSENFASDKVLAGSTLCVLKSQKRNKKSAQQGWSKLILSMEGATVKI